MTSKFALLLAAFSVIYLPIARLSAEDAEIPPVPVPTAWVRVPEIGPTARFAMGDQLHPPDHQSPFPRLNSTKPPQL